MALLCLKRMNRIDFAIFHTLVRTTVTSPATPFDFF
jgi:hypothetical protein